MRKILLLAVAAHLLLAVPGRAERDYFVGTKTGLKRTGEVFVDGKYKDNRLLLVIGTHKTGRALQALAHLKSRTTFIEDVRNGARTFGDQVSGSVDSIPENGKEFGGSLADLVRDPYNELKDPSIITPAKIIWCTVANIVKAGFYGAMIVVEPAGRTAYGTAALAIGPMIKPVSYAGVGTAIVATGTYGYTSSVTGGAVLSGATGAVLVMDLATSPFVGLYNQFSPAQPVGTGP